ncbi:MAG: 4-phosphoerythronate dehydrogenase [Candidatus Kapaibacterium sp.]
MSNSQIIFIDENIPLIAQALSPCGDIVTFSGRELKREDLIEGGATALIVRSTTPVGPVLLDGTGVRFVGSATSGIDHIDKEYLNSRGIAFADAPGSNANSVAEYMVYGILKWALPEHGSPEGKTLGVIGFGNIGTIISQYGHKMGMRVLVNDPPLLDSGFNFPDFVEYSEIGDIFPRADVVTNHVPKYIFGKYKTIGLIGRREIESMREGSLLMHASRGGVVDESPLLEALSENRISALIDVWANEPVINKSLAKMALQISPHVGGYSRDGKLRGTRRMADAFARFSGLSPDYSELDAELGEYRPATSDMFAKYDYLLKRIDESRDFTGDHRRLWESLTLDYKARAAAFDQLRKNYPVRRETL